MSDAGVPLRVTVVYSPAPREVREWALCLQPGATLRDALRASGLPQAFPGLDLATAEVGVWGRRANAQEPLRNGDRVEVYRPLQVDPKLARRERFRRQGTRGAGLFAGRKAGAKAGY
jgi:putative ubiquitin-RnfH superfamily antitoxin RatB of RatAB toxin-antitoxin module